MKRPPTEQKKIFANYTFHKGLMSKRNSYNSIARKQTIWLKNRQGTWIDTFPEKIQTAMGTWKGAQHHSPSGNTNQKHNEMAPHTCYISIINRTVNNECRRECGETGALGHSWWECGETGALGHSWWECKLVQPLWKTVWSFLKRLKIELPYDPVFHFWVFM